MNHNMVCPERWEKGRKLRAKHVNLLPINSGDEADGSFGRKNMIFIVSHDLED